MLKFLFRELIWRGGYGFFAVLGLNAALFFGCLCSIYYTGTMAEAFSCCTSVKALLVSAQGALIWSIGWCNWSHFPEWILCFSERILSCPRDFPSLAELLSQSSKKEMISGKKESLLWPWNKKSFQDLTVSSLETKLLDVTWCKMVYSGHKTNKY